MKKATALLIMLVAFALGCQKRPSLYGRWEVVGMPNISRGQQLVMEFNQPNQCNLLTVMPNTRVKGTFTFDGRAITFSFSDIVIDGNDDLANEAKTRLTQEEKRQRLDDFNKDPIMEIEWIGQDKFRVVDDKKTYICNRIH
jgi:hypothetical protein